MILVEDNVKFISLNNESIKNDINLLDEKVICTIFMN